MWVPLRPPVGRFVWPSALCVVVRFCALCAPFVWVAPPPSVDRSPFFILSATFILCMSSTASAAVLSHIIYRYNTCKSTRADVDLYDNKMANNRFFFFFFMFSLLSLIILILI